MNYAACGYQSTTKIFVDDINTLGNGHGNGHFPLVIPPQTFP